MPPPPEIAPALILLAKRTVPMADLAKPAVARHLADAISAKLDGTAAAPDTSSRRWRALSTALEYAVEAGVCRSIRCERSS